MITINDIKINYIYSFFVGIFNSDKRQFLFDWNEENTIEGKKIPKLKDIFLTKLQSSENVCVEYHESEEYEPLNNRSALYYKFPHFSIKKNLYTNVTIQNLFPQNKTGNISINIALFQTGMGIMWVSISINDVQNINIESIHKLNQREKMPLFILSDQSKTPDNIFQESIDNLVVAKLNAGLSTYSLFSKNEKDLFWPDNKNNYNRGSNVYQEPSIAIILKSDNYDSTENQNDFKTFVSSVLHGVSKEELDLNHSFSDNFKNLYHSNIFFTQIHGSCLLTVHKTDAILNNTTEEIQNYNEFKKFNHGLFRTYCAVRGTWYTYNLLNEKIDESLKLFNKEINKDIKGIDKAEYTEQNILLKNLYFQYINSEDPFIRGIGLTPFAEIYSESMKIYKSEEIKNNIRNKLKDYDKLIETINNYGYYKNVSSESSLNKGKKYLKYLYGMIALVSGMFSYNMINVSPDIFIICIFIASVFGVLCLWEIIKLWIVR